MPDLDKIIHELFSRLSGDGIRWRQIFSNPSSVSYYYAEGRLYIFKFEDGTYTLSKGGSPHEAFMSWLEANKAGVNRRFEKEIG